MPSPWNPGGTPKPEKWRCGKKADEALVLVLKTVAALEIPHLDMEHDGGEIVH